MLKRSKFILKVFAFIISTSIISTGITIRANAEVSEIYKEQLESYTLGYDNRDSLKEAVDENGVSWKYQELADGTICIKYAKNLKNSMEIPAKLDGKTVTVIDRISIPSHFATSENDLDTIVQSVKIPSTVKVIKSMAFMCKNLTKVELPSTTLIANDAFFCVPWFENQRNSQGLVIINGILLSAKNQSGDIIIPSNVKEIAANVFSVQDNITGVTIPNSVTEIRQQAFNACPNLKKVKISNGNIHLSDDSFSRCNKLTDVELPATASLEESTFQETPWLNNQECSDGLLIVNDVLIGSDKVKGDITIPSNVRKIGYFAFGGNDDITSIKIPSGVKIIGQSAFQHCSNLKKVEIPNSVTEIKDYAFQECTSLEKIEIPGSVKKIGSSAFVDCSKLSEVTLGEGIETIGSSAFTLCKNVKAFKLPSSVVDTAHDTAFDLGTTIIKNGVSYVIKDPAASNSNKPNNSQASSTKVISGWHKEGENWYWLWSDGSKRTGWYDENGEWYYFYGNGQMATEFTGLGNGFIYYLKPNSVDGKASMITGWQKINGEWFYFNPNSDGYKGMMKRGWIYDGGNWYYLYSTGEMAHNTTIDGYYVNSNGAWVG